MGYCLNRLNEPVFMAGPKPMLTEFGIHQKIGELWGEMANWRVKTANLSPGGIVN